MKKKCILLWIPLLLPLFLLAQSDTAAVPGDIPDSTEPHMALRPNLSAKSIMTPTGWCGSGNFMFASIGGTFPQVYSNDPDLIACIGIGIGDAEKYVQFTGILNINDVSQFSNLSGTFIFSRRLNPGSSMSGGIIHAFADRTISDFGPSAFFAYSHAVQHIPSKTPGRSKMSYTIGIGSGRFVQRSDEDIQRGKNAYGTAVFAGISYEIIRNLNVNAEWTGLNVCVSVSYRPFPKLPPVSFGLTDLTRLSGDKPRFVCGTGYSIRLPNFK